MMKWIFLLCLSFLDWPVHAQQTGLEPHANGQETLLNGGGKFSPKQRAELAKAAMADSNQQVNAKILAAHQVKPGVITLASGVQYKILKTGAGKRPTDQSSIRCRYLGMLADGTPFDKGEEKSSMVLRVAGLLPGLNEAVKLMPAGSKWEVLIPPELAYGSQGNRVVGPNSALMYVIEILGVL